jgi:hypothetical protein
MASTNTRGKIKMEKREIVEQAINTMSVSGLDKPKDTKKWREDILKQTLSSTQYEENFDAAMMLFLAVVKEIDVTIYGELRTGIVVRNPVTRREATYHDGWDLWDTTRYGNFEFNQGHSFEEAVAWIQEKTKDSKFFA